MATDDDFFDWPGETEPPRPRRGADLFYADLVGEPLPAEGEPPGQDEGEAAAASVAAARPPDGPAVPRPTCTTWVAATDADVARDQTGPRYQKLKSELPSHKFGEEWYEWHNGRYWKLRVVGKVPDPGVTTYDMDIRGWICADPAMPTVTITAPARDARTRLGAALEIDWRIDNYRPGLRVSLHVGPDPDNLSTSLREAPSAKGAFLITPKTSGDIGLTVIVADETGQEVARSPVVHVTVVRPRGRYRFSVDKIRILKMRSQKDVVDATALGDDDWLTITWTINHQTFSKTFHLGSVRLQKRHNDTFDIVPQPQGPWHSDPFTLSDDEHVNVTYAISNVRAAPFDDKQNALYGFAQSLLHVLTTALGPVGTAISQVAETGGSVATLVKALEDYSGPTVADSQLYTFKDVLANVGVPVTNAFAPSAPGSPDDAPVTEVTISIVEEPAAMVAVRASPAALDVFAVGAEHELLHKSWDGQRWGPSNDWLLVDSPFPVSSTPAITSLGANRIDVFATDADLRLQHGVLARGSWRAEAPWEHTMKRSTDAPSSVSLEGNDGGRVDVFVRETNGRIYHLSGQGSQSLSSFAVHPLGGPVVGPPVVLREPGASGALHAFAVQSYDRLLLHTKQGPSGAWVPLEEICSAPVKPPNTRPYLVEPPGVISTRQGHIDVFAILDDRTLGLVSWDSSVNGGKWPDAWTPLGGPPKAALLGAPVCVSWGGPRVDVFVIGVDYALYHLVLVDGRPQAWQPLANGPELVNNVCLSALPRGNDKIDVFAVTNLRRYYHLVYTDGARQPPAWEQLG